MMIRFRIGHVQFGTPKLVFKNVLHTVQTIHNILPCSQVLKDILHTVDILTNKRAPFLLELSNWCSFQSKRQAKVQGMVCMTNFAKKNSF